MKYVLVVTAETPRPGGQRLGPRSDPASVPRRGRQGHEQLVLAAAYVGMALGLNIIVGFAGLLDLGYVAFFAIGAYTAGTSAPVLG